MTAATVAPEPLEIVGFVHQPVPGKSGTARLKCGLLVMRRLWNPLWLAIQLPDSYYRKQLAGILGVAAT